MRNEHARPPSSGTSLFDTDRRPSYFSKFFSNTSTSITPLSTDYLSLSGIVDYAIIQASRNRSPVPIPTIRTI